MFKSLVAGLLGGITLFVWGMVNHMALPIWDKAVGELPANVEQAVVDDLRGQVTESKAFYIPGMPGMEADENTYKAWEDRVKSGPRAMLLYRPDGAAFSFLRNLAIEFGSNFIAAWFVAMVVGAMRVGYGGRVFAAMLFGLVGWLSISVSYWNWYTFPDLFTAGEAIDQVGGWLMVGLIMGVVLRRPASSPSPASV